MASFGVGMYPHPPMAPMAYPWMPSLPYFMKPLGSQVPLVPIPKLKPQQPVSAPRAKKFKSKKSEGKTKKVASVSFLGLLFFILLFGELVPMVNVKYGAMRESLSGGSYYVGDRMYDQQHGRVLSIKGHLNQIDHKNGIGLTNEKLGIHCRRGHAGGVESNVE
ncbi:unnamed protein product [Ilex paraguariensis]|uniref:Transmembrane protein n=1 Tax=Ilex paraguariensis TaxID=185542 RepID=A0ABC8SK46_9AQUA